MPRLRAFLALLLIATWCSAAWHVDLEAIGILFEHSHHAHCDNSQHAPLDKHDGHEQVVARDIAKDQLRVGGGALLLLAFLGFVAWLAAAAIPPVTALATRGVSRETDPPFTRTWQFIFRCAPLSVAPPAGA